MAILFTTTAGKLIPLLLYTMPMYAVNGPISAYGTTISMNAAWTVADRFPLIMLASDAMN